MKKILLFLPVFLLAIYLSGCKKSGEDVVINGTITQNTLSNLSDPSFELLMDSAATVFQTFEWTAVDYGFPAKITYILQVDTVGNEFANAGDVVTVNSVLEADVTVGDLNKLLLGLGFPTGSPSTLEFRVKVFVNDNVDPVYSNSVQAIITPYAVIFPPIYMCGAATGGWSMPDKAVEVRSTQAGVYSTIAYFGPQNETFRFFKQKDWGPVSYNYPYFSGSVSVLFENANDGDKNFKFLGTAGYYRITVNMTSKSVDLESVPEPKMFMTGAALGGWDWSTNYVQMTWKSDGVFEAITDFAVETFRFFAQADWGPTSYNYPYFADGSVSALFENANDGDKNFKFIGTPGSYKITLNMLDLIITMEAQ